MLWIDYFRERDTTALSVQDWMTRCGLITLGNEIQLAGIAFGKGYGCGLITLGNEIQLWWCLTILVISCGLITLGNEIQLKV